MPSIRLALALSAALAALASHAGPAHAGQWLSSSPLPGPADGAGGFDAAAGPDGTVVAAWSRLTAGRSQIVASVRPPGGEFSAPEPLSAPGGGSPHVAVDGRGTATVVWEQQVGNSALFTIEQSTRPAGGSFSTPQDLSAFTDEARFPDVAGNRRGDTLVTWTNRITSPNFVEAVGRPAGGVFGSKVRVSGANVGTQDAVDSHVAVSENGTGMVVWEREGGFVQAAAWSAALNDFAPLFNVTSGGAAEFGASPDVGMAPDGSAVFAYFGTVNGANPQIKARTRTNGVLGAATKIADLPTNSGTPSLVSDGAGDMLVAWNSGSSVLRAAYRPAGQGFGADQTLSGPLSGSDAFRPPSLAMTAGGDAVAAWVTGAAGSRRVQARVIARGGTLSALQDDFPVHAGVGVTAFADGEGNLGTVSRRTGTGDPGTLEVRPFDAAAPRPLGIRLPAEAIQGRAAPFSATFLDTWSPFAVSWSFGDGAGATGATVQHAYAGPGAFTVAATATDAAGNRAAQSGVASARALRLDEIDGDGDAFTADKDCADGDPAIHPGAREIRGNAVDENCDGLREPFLRVAGNASLGVLFGRGFIGLSTLKLTGLERGDTVKLSCAGRGCRRPARATIVITRTRARLDLSRRVRGARLRKGARLQVEISHAGLTARVFRFEVVRLGVVPRRTELCRLPGAKRPGRC